MVTSEVRFRNALPPKWPGPRLVGYATSCDTFRFRTPAIEPWCAAAAYASLALPSEPLGDGSSAK